MKDIDHIIEQIHDEARTRLEVGEQVRSSKFKVQSSRFRVQGLKRHHVWRYAAAVVVAVVGIGYLRHVANTTQQNSQANTGGQTYAYNITSKGIKVYCEDNCNADEVLERMNNVIEKL